MSEPVSFGIKRMEVYNSTRKLNAITKIKDVFHIYPNFGPQKCRRADWSRSPNGLKIPIALSTVEVRLTV